MVLIETSRRIQKFSFILWLIIITSGVAALASPDTTATYTPAKLKSDLSYLQQVLEKVHPSLYRYTSKDSLDKFFRDACLRVNKPLSEVQFWTIAQRLIARIHSGHTQLYLSEATIDIEKKTDHYYLPFKVLIRNNRLFIKSYLGTPDTSFNFGDEILSIDNEPPQRLFDEVRTLISGDGYSLSFKNKLLENGEFNRLYQILYPEKKRYQIEITSLEKGKRILIVTGAHITGNNIIDGYFHSDEIKDQLNYPGQTEDITSKPILTFADDMPGTAFLKISQFNYVNEYQDIHDQIFHRLKSAGAKNLVLDLRNNTGGAEIICNDLLQYLINGHFQFSGAVEGKIDPANGELIHDTAKLKSIKKTYFRKSYPGNQLQELKKNHFDGALLLLVDGGTFSAASLLAVALKCQRNCTVLGSETGGGAAGCDGGTIETLILPNTKLQLFIPLLWTYSVGTAQNTGHGLLPDIKIYPSITDQSYHIIKREIEKSGFN